MYVHAIDETHAVLLGIYAGAKSPDDLDGCLESLLRADRIAHAQGRGALFVIAPDPEYPSPTSQDRQRFAAFNDSCRAAPNLFILVTRSPILRGVITAVSWLSPPNERWRSIACESLTEAVGRAGQYRNGCGGSLQRLERGLREGLITTKAG